jgi:Ca-activated chloride channel family protein
MLKINIITFLIFFGLHSFAQIEFIDAPYDVGIVTAAGGDYLDIPIKNTSDKKVFIFRTDASKQFQIYYSSKTILPDSIIFMRVLYTPTQKGSINEDLPIHFSCFDEPVVVNFTGFTENIPTSNNTSCPNFNQHGANVKVTFDFTVKVVDAETGELIPESTVELIKNGSIFEILNTKKKGFVERPLELGYYYFIGSNELYESNEFGAYVNRKNNIITIPLTKKAIEEPLLVIEETIDPEIEEVEAIVEEEPLVISNEVENEPETVVELYPEFSLRDFRPNNIVFLVDVSSSMNQGGKLDLLKASMIELAKILRPVDKITVVSYATKANVILETTSGEDVDSVISVIENLKAKGVTAGGKGMERAYSKACNAFIADGNNQIIMATDGLFNSGDEDVYKLARKYSKKDVKVSVVGIKNQSSHEKYMKNLARDGKGSYANVKTYNQAKETLVEEIKSQSKIRK